MEFIHKTVARVTKCIKSIRVL